MSETDKQRMSLVGVNPNSRTLKFLNTKNNIATMTLKKQIDMFEREKTFSMNSIETKRLDTKQFLKQVKTLESETEESKKYLDREDISITPPPPTKPQPRRRRRKIRLAQTAPPTSKTNDEKHNIRPGRKEANSGPETQAEKDQMLKLTRKKSMFLQLSGTGTKTDVRCSSESPTKLVLPKPNPKTLLDVMIGLNAFSHLPSPQHPIDPVDSFRGESRMSVDQDSLYGSHEYIAKKFMTQWKNRVASRKLSIINKLDAGSGPIDLSSHRCESTNLSSVPEGPPTSSHMKRRKSKWSVRQNKTQPTLPAIYDEDERKHQFLAWVQDEQEKMRSHKGSLFANISPSDKQSQRRKSFTFWLQKRQQERPPNDNSSDEEEMGVLRDISEDEEEDQPATVGDLMKTILKIKTRFKDSLSARVKRFNNELDQIRKRDEEARNKPMSPSQKRRYKMLIHGIDAALADSSDEDDIYNFM